MERTIGWKRVSFVFLFACFMIIIAQTATASDEKIPWNRQVFDTLEKLNRYRIIVLDPRSLWHANTWNTSSDMRMEVAGAFARAFLETGDPRKIDEQDLRNLKELVAEFADELQVLGLKEQVDERLDAWNPAPLWLLPEGHGRVRKNPFTKAPVTDPMSDALLILSFHWVITAPSDYYFYAHQGGPRHPLRSRGELAAFFGTYGLPYLDRTRMSKQDMAILQKLLVEFVDEFTLLGMMPEILEKCREWRIDISREEALPDLLLWNTRRSPFEEVPHKHWTMMAAQELQAKGILPRHDPLAQRYGEPMRYDLGTQVGWGLQNISTKKLDSADADLLGRLVEEYRDILLFQGVDIPAALQSIFKDSGLPVPGGSNENVSVPLPGGHWSCAALSRIVSALPQSVDIAAPVEPVSRQAMASTIMGVLWNIDLRQTDRQDAELLLALASEFRPELEALDASLPKIREYLLSPFLMKPYRTLPAESWIYAALSRLEAHGVLLLRDPLSKKPFPTNRYNMAILIRRALPELALHRADREDVELIKRLAVEFSDILTVWGVDVESLIRLPERWTPASGDQTTRYGDPFDRKQLRVYIRR